MPKLTLYGTLGCHLCDEAEAWLKHAFGSIDYQKVDIANDELLVEQYGIRIPVLSTGAKEFDWPFQYDELVKTMEQVRASQTEDKLTRHTQSHSTSNTKKPRRVLAVGVAKE